MNERIKELALKCGAWHQVYPPNKFMHDNNFDIEKFAELIIQECATIADTDFLPKGVGCGYITYTTGERIKKHFGKI